MDKEQFIRLAFISLVAMKEHPRNEEGADVVACLLLAQEMWEVLCRLELRSELQEQD